MTYTLENIHTSSSYDVLKRNGFTDIDVVTYYGTHKSNRAAMFIQIKRDSAQEIKSTQMCTVNIDSVRDMAITQMNKTFLVDNVSFNMVDMGFSLNFNQRKSAFGVCNPRRKVIELSLWMITNTNNDMAFWLDTILHEIAHAIDFMKRGTSDHSWKWKQIALVVGCDGNRTGEADFIQDEINSKYTLTCVNCKTKRPSHKKKKRISACPKCCKKYNFGRYSLDYKLVQTQNY
jgi:predicted SprT family Zn-dependent metalloprotease